MCIHRPQAELFSCRVKPGHCVRKDHPLRHIARVIDFTFVRAEITRCYGTNGDEGVAPIIRASLVAAGQSMGGPKGLNKPAQGSALRQRRTAHPALKGRDNPRDKTGRMRP
jgi:hypothetical protein